MDARDRSFALLDVFLWLLVGVMTLVVAYTSLTPPSGEPPLLSDKAFHYLAYAGLTMSLLLAAVWAPARGDGAFPGARVTATLLTFAFGVVIELIQVPLSQRDASVLDALANAGGALTALILWTLWRGTSTRGGRTKTSGRQPGSAP